MPFRSDSAVNVVEVTACKILQIVEALFSFVFIFFCFFSIPLVRMKSDEVKPARDASCAVDRLIAYSSG